MWLNSKTRLLVISPHPDDEAIGVGGLIGKCIKEKAVVFVYYLCVGPNRQLVTGSTDEKIRLKEIKSIEKMTGIKTKIEITNKQLHLDTVPQLDLINAIEDVIESFKPSIVAIPSHSSYNQDHRAVYSASIAALRPIPRKIRYYVPTVIEYFEPYFWSIGTPSPPNLYLDLSQEYKKGNLLDFKIKYYSCHKTQVREDPHPRSKKNLIRIAGVYGSQFGVKIAEAYYLIRQSIC